MSNQLRTLAALILGLGLQLGLSSAAVAQNSYFVNVPSGNTWYPIKPDATLTPGRLCEYATRLRYPEKIKYCERDVDPQEKARVIAMYDAKLGFKVGQGNRNQFKIDHYIPLCMGGSNDVQNLWPQHQTVFNITDPMEPLLCEKMAQGKLKQADAIKLIKQGKNDLSQVKAILEYAQRL